MEAKAPVRLRVVGVGNVLRKDEGAGVRAVRMLEGRVPEGVELVDGGTAGGALLDLFTDGVPSIVIDAALLGLAPGSWRRIEWRSRRGDAGAFGSAHEETMATTLSLAEQLTGAPPDVTIYVIEPKDLRWGTDLSWEVARGVEGLTQAVADEVGFRFAQGSSRPATHRREE